MVLDCCFVRMGVRETLMCCMYVLDADFSVGGPDSYALEGSTC